MVAATNATHPAGAGAQHRRAASRGAVRGARWHVFVCRAGVRARARARERGAVSAALQGNFARGVDFLFVNIGTLLRVALPSVLAAMLGYAYFDNISLFLYQNWLSAGIDTLHPITLHPNTLHPGNLHPAPWHPAPCTLLLAKPSTPSPFPDSF